jgi:Domain of unknown function (DUF1844)
MAEVQTSTQSGELSQRFIEFVMMHAQNAALFLGQIPNPKTGEGEVNLELAKMFIDQLAMIQEKTRGNLTNEETTVLRNTLSNLQMVYVEVARQAPKGTTPSTPPEPEEPAPSPQTASSAGAAAAGGSTAAEQPPIASPESEPKKKFTKSYGP